MTSYMEIDDMEKHLGQQRMSSRARSSLTAAALTMLVAMLVTVSAVPAAAQFNSGSTGVNGAFPPVPPGANGNPGAIPSDGYFIIWNVKTGLVRYCNVYSLTGTVSEQCDVASTTNVTAQIQGIPQGGVADGVYNFTDFTLSPLSGQRWLVPVGYSSNVPLTILSQGDITIGSPGTNVRFMMRGWDGKQQAGSVAGFSTVGGRGGPGAFDGGASGNGGTTPSNGNAGFGPSGGAGGPLTGNPVAQTYGLSATASPLNPSLTPLSGGSGGGGAAGIAGGYLGCENAVAGYGGGSGGGGGGGLLLAATGRVTLSSSAVIEAQGGNGGQNPGTGCRLYGGGGAGGSIRIVAAEFTGSGAILVGGGSRLDGTFRASGGFVRIETALNTFTGSIDSAAGGSFLSFATAPLPVTAPTLRITALNGVNAPSIPTASLSIPDITFQQSIETPVTLEVSASNVPLGTAVQIKVVPATGQPTTATTSGLGGSVANSTAQASVTLPPGAGIVTASATFTVAAGQSAGLLPASLPLINGQRPEQVEVVAMGDGKSRTYLVSKSGERFEVGRAEAPRLQ